MFYITDENGNRVPALEGGDLANVETLTANKTLTVEDSGKTFNIGTDALVITLPATALGLKYTFRNIGADGNNIITISPNAADAVFGTVQNAAADSVASGAADKDIINTKATANRGDFITLEADGVDGWYITGGVGIWASEA
ncbi:hypothetical protein [Tenacibaculum sp.]|uniref:hypothetical protein n=1 Tax=Tenacibaculum sp. TaxID=1906242 RepID=UPI003D0DB1DD